MKAAIRGMAQVGMDRFETRGARHIVTHTMEMMMACLGMIWGGVMRQASRNFGSAFLESGGGWIVPWPCGLSARSMTIS